MANIQGKDIAVTFAKASQMSRIVGISSDALKKMKIQGPFIEGIHFVNVNTRLTLFNVPLVRDYFINADNPERHQDLVDWYTVYKDNHFTEPYEGGTTG